MFSSLLDIYSLIKDEKANSFLNKALKEDIRREVVFNRLLLKEILRLSKRKRKPLLNTIDLQLELKVFGLEKVFQIGLPLKELFSGYEIGELQKSERSFYLKKIIGERLEHSDLVEKLYARLIIAKAMANHKIEKDTRSIKYNIELLNFVLEVVFKLD